jgi:hypothetical protein
MKRPAHTVIYTHGGGRLGNQVLRFAHWMAWARAHAGEVEVVDLAFWPFAENFAVWREHPGCVYPLRAGRADWLARRRAALPRWLREWSEERCRLQRVVQVAGRWWPGGQAVELDIVGEESADLDDPDFFARIARRRVTTCCGWKIASWRLVAEQQAELRKFFRPAPEFARRSAEFITALRQRHDVVIGLFIRQSDYREWNDGRFYFSTVQYAAWVRQLLDLHGGRRVAIVIASEEWQDPAALAGLPCHFATGAPNAGGHWFESWIELSLCDFIVSPPSTFSATAAFLGGVPLWPLVSAEQTLSFAQLIADGLIGAARHPEFSCAVK